MSELSEYSTSSDSNLTEQEGGNIMTDIMQVSSVASSCTLLILCIIMTAVLSNKSYCK